jgi:hypothetical protein
MGSPEGDLVNRLVSRGLITISGGGNYEDVSTFSGLGAVLTKLQGYPRCGASGLERIWGKRVVLADVRAGMGHVIYRGCLNPLLVKAGFEVVSFDTNDVAEVVRLGCGWASRMAARVYEVHQMCGKDAVAGEMSKLAVGRSPSEQLMLRIAAGLYQRMDGGDVEMEGRWQKWMINGLYVGAVDGRMGPALRRVMAGLECNTVFGMHATPCRALAFTPYVRLTHLCDPGYVVRDPGGRLCSSPLQPMVNPVFDGRQWYSVPTADVYEAMVRDWGFGEDHVFPTGTVAPMAEVAEMKEKFDKPPELSVALCFSGNGWGAEEAMKLLGEIEADSESVKGFKFIFFTAHLGDDKEIGGIKVSDVRNKIRTLANDPRILRLGIKLEDRRAGSMDEAARLKLELLKEVSLALVKCGEDPMILRNLGVVAWFLRWRGGHEFYNGAKAVSDGVGLWAPWGRLVDELKAKSAEPGEIDGVREAVGLRLPALLKRFYNLPDGGGNWEWKKSQLHRMRVRCLEVIDHTVDFYVAMAVLANLHGGLTREDGRFLRDNFCFSVSDLPRGRIRRL